MFCPNCQSENPPGKKFCLQCGTALGGRCPRCGAENPPPSRFCGDCGAALDTGLPTKGPPATPATPSVRITPEESAVAALDGERKTVTALFADIKGSTEMMADLDPEKARAIVDPALALMMDAVHRYDGYVVQSTGDGIFALFGAPVAHEDHPQRALYAALRMREDLRRYSAKVVADGGTPIQCRIGVNTGEVVVRSIRTGAGHVEYTPIGHTTNLASRMQTAAPVGSIAVTEATRKLCEGYFTLTPLGATKIKGVSEPVDVYEVTGMGVLRTRLQVAAQRGFTKFVGRQAELEQMKSAHELVKTGHGQIVAAMGEPGVGKSRLFFEFKAIAQSGCLVLEAYSVSHGKASAYLPVIDLLKSYFEIAAEDDDRKRREKVAGKIVILDRMLEDTLSYLYALLGIGESEDPLAQLDPQLRRRRTLEAIKRVLVRESINQPLIVVFEDLHWIDSETQALLNLIVDGIATAKILLLVNYRPEYHHQWNNKTYYTQLRLDPLGKESADEMLAALLASPAPAAEAAGANRERPTVRSKAEDGRVRVQDGIAGLKRLIIERTEGNPFFMEEMVQSLFEQGVLVRNGVVKVVKPLDEIRVPPTVQAILASRIDRLPAAEKELMQTLAVLGREFPFGLIKRMVGKSDDELERMLSELQLAEFIYEQPVMGDIEYMFKHALTLEVAYNSVLVERRRLLHERAGQAMEELFADRLEDHLSELAHHYDRSGNAGKAVDYLGRAGGRAAQQMAHSEAIAHFNRALELLEQLPDGVERDRNELNLQMALGQSLFVARGPAAQERKPVLVRASELCEQVGDSARLMEALLALAHFHSGRRESREAQELAERVIVLAQAAGAPAMLAGAHAVLGLVLNALGQFDGAREHLERALELFGGEVPYGPLGRSASVVLSLVLFLLGYPTTALGKAREFLASARRLSDPYLIAYALFSDATLHTLFGDSHIAMERGEELLSTATEHSFGMFQLQSGFVRGWALAGLGRTEESIIEISRTISLQPRGEPRTIPYFCPLAQAYGKNGHPEQGLAAVAEGLTRVELSGERFAEAELHRVKGELLLMREPRDEAQAERCFRTAIDIARRQKGRFWELRATTSLARFLCKQGNRDDARQMLAEIYGWFTEGFDSSDLKDAKALLAELA